MITPFRGVAASSPIVRLPVMLLLLACTIVALTLCYATAIALIREGSFYRDFAAIWSFGRFAAAGHGADIYNEAALHPFQVAQTGVEHPYPYAYPPIFLLLLWPLGMVQSFAVAYSLWIGITFILYLCASCAGHARSSRLALLLTIAPATSVTAYYGQTGFLSSALLIGGFRLVSVRPVLSGVLFGCLAFKPHFGLLVPVALLAAGLWRPIVSAAATVGVLAGCSGLVFGPAIWLRWFAAVSRQMTYIEGPGSDGANQHIMPTVTANLLRLGVSPSIAHLAQIGVAIAVALLTWRCCRSVRRGTILPFGAAIVQAGSFLTTPYAFPYDMPMLTNAAVTSIVEKTRRGALFRLPEIAILVATFVLPLGMLLWRPDIPFSTSVLALFCLMLTVQARHAVAGRRDPSGDQGIH